MQGETLTIYGQLQMIWQWTKLRKQWTKCQRNSTKNTLTHTYRVGYKTSPCNWPTANANLNRRNQENKFSSLCAERLLYNTKKKKYEKIRENIRKRFLFIIRASCCYCCCTCIIIVYLCSHSILLEWWRVGGEVRGEEQEHNKPKTNRKQSRPRAGPDSVQTQFRPSRHSDGALLLPLLLLFVFYVWRLSVLGACEWKRKLTHTRTHLKNKVKVIAKSFNCSHNNNNNNKMK